MAKLLGGSKLEFHGLSLGIQCGLLLHCRARCGLVVVFYCYLKYFKFIYCFLPLLDSLPIL